MLKRVAWIRRLTIWFVLAPRRFLSDDGRIRFTLDWWSREIYEWEQDDWNGLKDYVQRIETTVETGTGDCDDYALTALDYLHRNTNHEIELVIAYRLWKPQGHLLVYDVTEERTYSNGNIRDEPISEYRKREDYGWYWRRRVT